MHRLGTRILIVLTACAALAGCLPCGKRQPELCDPSQHLGAHSLQEGEVVLTPEQVQRSAVLNSGLGKALEGDAGKDGHECLACLPSRKRAKLAHVLKAYAADEARNQTAGLALTAYYRLAEARLQLQLIFQGLDIADRLVAQAEEMQKKGLTLPQDMTVLLRARSDVVADRLKLELLRDRLTEQIRQLADGKLCACRIGTVEVFEVTDDPLDEKEAITTALKYRADLNGLRAARTNLDASTLPLIRQLLGGAHPLLGDKVRRCVPMVECLPRVLPLLAAGELEKVRKELDGLICERERQAVSEVRQALAKIRFTTELARQAQHRQGWAQKRLAELEEKAGKGLSTDGELPKSQRDQVKMRGEVLHEAIEFHIAKMELRLAQGLLVREVMGECDCEGNKK